MTSLDDLPTPSILVYEDRLERNLRHMQQACDDAGIALRPHIKTHKLVPIARRQLELGAKGLTCAKLGEAEAMLPSGVREIFIAHSLVDLRQAPRIAALADQLDELRVAVTSEAHLDAFLPLIRKVDRPVSVMIAIDTGLNREGIREDISMLRIAKIINQEPLTRLAGVYTHEGQFYGHDHSQRANEVDEMLDHLSALRSSMGLKLDVWPGCSVTARAIVASARGRVQAVRPGAYVFGDLSLTQNADVMPWDDVALHVLATVVDKPTDELTLIDAGSKTFSSDKTRAGISAVAADGRHLEVFTVNEEHGYLRGNDLDQVKVGDRIAFVPAHVCTVINLTDSVQVISADNTIRTTWPVDARGKNQ
ncbi:alanine racemase [Opitutaceae bacterium]|nr:alanine racemase [Opitutaceae bacterium]